MRVVPLAAESLGVRSMATYVEAGRLRILMDPGATLGPRRFNLPPAAEEEEALERALDRIEAYAVRAHLVTVSHYHRDHLQVSPGLYAGRRVWAKDPNRMITPDQRARARLFWRDVKARSIVQTAEGRTDDFGDVTVKVSPPLAHGADGGRFGFVVAVTVDDGVRFVHGSDVQGPLSPVATAYLLRERPQLLYLSGPPTYLESQLGRAEIERGVENLLRIIEAAGCQVIMDHHALRDLDRGRRLDRLYATGRVVSAARYLGRPDQLLEARRAALWGRARRAGRSRA